MLEKSDNINKIEENEEKEDTQTLKESNLDDAKHSENESKEDDPQIKQTDAENLSSFGEELNEEKTDKKNQEILENEVAALKEEKLRLLAEMENLRKRFEKEKADSIRYGNVMIAKDILSTYDNLVRALNVIADKNDLPEFVENMVGGLKMVQKDFMTTLEKHGVREIKIAENEKFDPNLHQAVSEIQVDNEKDEGHVGLVIQTGFTIHDRLLRPAMVGVTKKTENNKKAKKKQ